jgi:hypothetical protein
MSEPVNYSAVTPRIGFPMLFAGQSQKEVTVNEALILLDILVGAGVHGIRNDPPATEKPGSLAMRQAASLPRTAALWQDGQRAAGDLSHQGKDCVSIIWAQVRCICTTMAGKQRRNQWSHQEDLSSTLKHAGRSAL